MAQYSAEIVWERGDAIFTDNRYPRRHRWRFDGGLEVPGSSSPHSVPVPLSDPSAVDPEEALIAALSSCHMLTFLAIACKQKFVLDDYVRRGDAGQADPAPVGVTAREREIIQLVAEGRSNKEAAAALGISVKTIEAHRSNIMRKLHLRSVSDLVRYAIRNKIAEP